MMRPVLAVRQPWAWLLIHGGKDVENRDWYTGFRGQLAILASKGMTRAEYVDAVWFVRQFDPGLADRIPAAAELARGAVIGTVEVTDCVRRHTSPWFQGTYGLVVRDPQPCEPVPLQGRLGIFLAELPGWLAAPQRIEEGRVSQ